MNERRGIRALRHGRWSARDAAAAVELREARPAVEGRRSRLRGACGDRGDEETDAHGSSGDGGDEPMGSQD